MLGDSDMWVDPRLEDDDGPGTATAEAPATAPAAATKANRPQDAKARTVPMMTVGELIKALQSQPPNVPLEVLTVTGRVFVVEGVSHRWYGNSRLVSIEVRSP